MIKKIKTIIIILNILLIGIIALFIDLLISRSKGTPPLFAVAQNNIKEQYTLYHGLFYNMWICSAEEKNYYFGVKAPVCPKAILFDENGLYTTVNNIQLSKENYEIIRQYYNYDQINEWTNIKQLKDALKISYEYKRLTWAFKTNYYTYYKGEHTIIGVFYNLVEKENGNFKWQVMWDDETYHYCIKLGQDNKSFIRSKYKDGSCLDDWNYFKLEGEVCKIYKKSNLSNFDKSQIYSLCNK